MTNVLVKRRFRDRHTRAHRQERPCKAKDSDAPTSQAMPGATKSWKRQRTAPRASERLRNWQWTLAS